MTLGGILVVCLVAWAYREPIRGMVMQTAILHNDAPAASVVEEMIAQAAAPGAAIVAAWHTDKVVHREVAVRQIGRTFPKGQPLPSELEAILMTGALDVDQNVCEAAFSGLLAWSHPALPSLARWQLGNVDPEIRRLGLHFLRWNEHPTVVEAIGGLLDDPQPDIAALAIQTLGRFARQDFGIKMSEAMAVDNETSGRKEFRVESVEKVQAAAALARAWLRERPRVASEPLAAVPEWAMSQRRRIPASDFELEGLDGKEWRLSELRGKVVLINFWTTWCTACLGEIPALIDIRKRHGADLVILGVSLDALEDSHGHVGGHGDDSQGDAEGHDSHEGHGQDVEERAGAMSDMLRKVEAVVKRHRINYPILVDARNQVGSRYNGGELPTTVLVDREGFVCRRFVGPRSVAVLEAMIRQAAEGDPLLGAPLVQ
jgi:peroxiredoxin